MTKCSVQRRELTAVVLLGTALGIALSRQKAHLTQPGLGETCVPITSQLEQLRNTVLLCINSALTRVYWTVRRYPQVDVMYIGARQCTEKAVLCHEPVAVVRPKATSERTSSSRLYTL